MIVEKKRIQQHYKKAEKGQSLVELAIGITILIWLLSGIVDVGRAIFTQFALQDAAEEGLVYGIGYPDRCDEIEARVLNNLQNGVLPNSPEITVLVNSSPCGTVELAYGLPMDVEVSSTFVMTMPFLAGNSLTLKGTANGTILRPPPES